jgi:hypothetical protein
LSTNGRAELGIVICAPMEELTYDGSVTGAGARYMKKVRRRREKSEWAR